MARGNGHGNSNPTELSQDQIEMMCEHIIALRPLDQLPGKLNFTSKYAFYRFLKKNPAHNEAYQDARLAACQYLEDELYRVADQLSAGKAKVKADAICRLLAFLDPKRYGPKMDVNLNQTISIRANIEAANSRVASLMLKDVTPQIPALANAPLDVVVTREMILKGKQDE